LSVSRPLRRRTLNDECTRVSSRSRTRHFLPTSSGASFGNSVRRETDSDDLMIFAFAGVACCCTFLRAPRGPRQHSFAKNAFHVEFCAGVSGAGVAPEVFGGAAGGICSCALMLLRYLSRFRFFFVDAAVSSTCVMTVFIRLFSSFARTLCCPPGVRVAPLFFSIGARGWFLETPFGRRGSGFVEGGILEILKNIFERSKFCSMR